MRKKEIKFSAENLLESAYEKSFIQLIILSSNSHQSFALCFSFMS